MHDPHRSSPLHARTPAAGRPDATVCRPRRHRGTALAVSTGLCLAAMLITGTAAAAARAARPAQIPQAQADHWGFFFGNSPPGGGDQRKVPTAIRLPGPVAEVGSSNSTEYALLTNGTLWSWGEGGNGELGNGSTRDSFDAAVQVRFPPGVRIASIPTDAMPYDTGLAVDTHGTAWGWGLNHGGSLCLGNSQPHDVPVRLPLTGVTALAGADGHAVYDTNGQIVSCGDNPYGVLGDGTERSSDSPVPVTGLGGQPVRALVSSWNDAGALLANGEYLDWGYDNQGQLGDGTIGQSSPVPVRVRVPDPATVTQVAEGGSTPDNGQTIVMLSDGTLWAWGDDSFSQLGDGGSGVRPSPVPIQPPAGVRYAVLASGGATSYALTTSGDVYAWGVNRAGEVGDGGTRTAVTPVRVDSGATVISSTAGNVVAASTAR
jgi:alpha-tubulin suppressor-like RCC1 family protein